MAIRDRGMKKWTSFFVPEHVSMLNEMYEEQAYKKKPVLDEQEIETINASIHYAIFEGIPVEITYYHNHDYLKVKSPLRSVDSIQRIVQLENEEHTKIPFDDILEVKVD